MVPKQMESDWPVPPKVYGPARNWVQFVFVPLCLASVAGVYVLIDKQIVSGALAYTAQGLMLVSTIYLIGKGAGWFVEAASRIAESLGISHLVIGLTVVAFGTSAPEMAASIGAGFRGSGDIAVANVIGSNIFNLCLILGTVALVTRRGLPVDRDVIVRDGPLLIVSSVVLLLFVGGLPVSWATDDPGFGPHSLGLLNFTLERHEGTVLFLCLLLYLLWLYRVGRSNRRIPEFDHERIVAHTNKHGIPNCEREAGLSRSAGAPARSLLKDLMLFGIGITLVLGACHLLVGHAEVSNGAVRGYGALWFAKMLRVPDYLVGLTIVAVGTSAPEFVVSLVAAQKGRFGICIGNLAGSSLFNVMGVIGLAGVILQQPLCDPVAVTSTAIVSFLALIGITVAAVLMMLTKQRVTRFEGLALVLLGLSCWIGNFLSQEPSAMVP